MFKTVAFIGQVGGLEAGCGGSYGALQSGATFETFPTFKTE